MLRIWSGSVSIDWHFAGYLSDEGSPRGREPTDMSVFRDAVQDCLDYEHTPVVKPGKLNRPKASNDPEVERFSGLRIRYISCFFLTSTRGNKRNSKLVLICFFWVQEPTGNSCRAQRPVLGDSFCSIINYQVSSSCPFTSLYIYVMIGYGFGVFLPYTRKLIWFL